MVERLIHSLQALAAPADVQLGRFPDFVAKADELALDFADAVLLVTDCPQVTLSAVQRDALERLDAHLGAMSGAAGRAFWSDAAVRGAPGWAETRRLARVALAALHAPVDLPPPTAAAYFRGAAP